MATDPTPAALKVAYAALSPVPASDEAAATTLNAQTVTVTVATSFPAVMALLYARGSWRRVQQVASGDIAASTLTPPTGSTASDVVAICQMLVSQARPPGAPIDMTVASVSSAVQADLTLLADTKLTDGKGVIWAAAEYASGDPGDAAVLMATLAQATLPAWSRTITEGDVQTARAQP